MQQMKREYDLNLEKKIEWFLNARPKLFHPLLHFSIPVFSPSPPSESPRARRPSPTSPGSIDASPRGCLDGKFLLLNGKSISNNTGAKRRVDTSRHRGNVQNGRITGGWWDREVGGYIETWKQGEEWKDYRWWELQGGGQIDRHTEARCRVRWWVEYEGTRA